MNRFAAVRAEPTHCRSIVYRRIINFSMLLNSEGIMLRKSLIILTFAGIAAGSPSLALGVGEGGVCGGIAGIACDGKLWCDPEPGHCGGADIAGKCIAVPEICNKIFKPVCGCDDKTYSNDCERQAAKVAKKSEGACKEYNK
ncbi:Kazal-type serine protease inhibitor family protein [Methylocapsa polymorpha]|uniref:Kazal-type serine protease inhibitor family protein n=1 Tax=Methylocapsa polymorpha TaxID=3080828 RepID=A0ABZ0HTN7_9HYPH|nr:Kazal-type serine protease inhibitor family protein [Methylocapsa sp. RX1]